MHKSEQVQGDGIQYVEWDSRHQSPGLYSGSGRRVLLFGQLHMSEWQLRKGRENTYQKSVSYIRQDEEGLEE